MTHDAKKSDSPWTVWVLFFVFSSAVVCGLSLDLRPPPFYPTLFPAESEPACPVVRGQPITIRFKLAGRFPNSLSIPCNLDGSDAALTVSVRDPRSNSELVRHVARTGDRAVVDLGNLPADLNGLSVVFSSDAADTESAPRLTWSSAAPRFGAAVHVADRRIAGRGPLIVLEYPWPTRMALLAWVPMVLLFAAARRRKAYGPAFLVMLGLACTISSILLWQPHYSRHFGHWDADDYGTCARTLADYLMKPHAREQAADWLGKYPHSHTALAPALMALPIALGVPTHIAYLELSALCGFGSLWLFFGILRRRLRLSAGVALMGVACCACHVLALRSFSRPVTDAMGWLLTVWTLDLLLARMKQRTPWQTVGLAVLVLLHPLARPQGVAYIPFIAFAACLGDWVREARWCPGVMLRTAAGLLVVPAVVLGALYASFGWSHNVALMLKKAEQFRVASNSELFTACMVGACQCLPLLWFLGWRRLRDPRCWLLLIWGIYYVVILICVQAPFWLRHFVPILPVVVGLAAIGLQEGVGRLRRAGGLVALVFCLTNLAAALWQIFLWDDIPEKIRPYISSG